MRRTLSLLVLCVSAACAEGGSSVVRERPPVPVETYRVAPARLTHTVTAVGSLESPQSTEITAEYAGTVVLLDVPEGREVEAGHLLARIDDEEARAAVRVTRARVRNAAEIFERLRALRGSEVTSQQELDTAETTLDAAHGELDEAETALRKTAIRAPFRGVLGLREVSLGEYLQPGEAVTRITQVTPLKLVFSVPERYVGRIEVGQPIRGVVASCDAFAGEVRVVDPHVDPESRALRVQAEVPNEARRFLPGMSATVRVEVGATDGVLAIPREAIIRRGTKRTVFVVDADQTVREEEVTLGELGTDLAYVEAGITEGDLVVATGHQKLRPGAPVAPQPYVPVENPNLALGESAPAPGCRL